MIQDTLSRSQWLVKLPTAFPTVPHQNHHQSSQPESTRNLKALLITAFIINSLEQRSPCSSALSPGTNLRALPLAICSLAGAQEWEWPCFFAADQS